MYIYICVSIDNHLYISTCEARQAQYSTEDDKYCTVCPYYTYIKTDQHTYLIYSTSQDQRDELTAIPSLPPDYSIDNRRRRRDSIMYSTVQYSTIPMAPASAIPSPSIVQHQHAAPTAHSFMDQEEHARPPHAAARGSSSRRRRLPPAHAQQQPQRRAASLSRLPQPRRGRRRDRLIDRGGMRGREYCTVLYCISRVRETGTEMRPSARRAERGVVWG